MLSTLLLESKQSSFLFLTYSLIYVSFCVFLLLPWPSVYIACMQKIESAYLSSIWICMLGNLFFTQKDGRWEAVMLINISILRLLVCASALKVYLCDGVFWGLRPSIFVAGGCYAVYYEHPLPAVGSQPLPPNGSSVSRSLTCDLETVFSNLFIFFYCQCKNRGCLTVMHLFRLAYWPG